MLMLSIGEIEELVEVVVKAVVALVLVGVVVYCLVVGLPVDDRLMVLVLAILGVYFGLESFVGVARVRRAGRG